MREIKFRLWDIQDSIMYGAERGWYVDMEGNIRQHPDMPPLRDVVLMQFTGLKDKNEKEIYEGDIVDGFGNRFVIKWGVFRFRKLNEYGDVSLVDVPSFAFTLEGDIPRYPIVSNWRGEHDLNGLEIVGNIYENPELLED